MKRILHFGLLIVALTALVSCNRNAGSDEEEDMRSLPENSATLLEGMVPSGFRLHDTVNSIKGMIIFPRYLAKDEDNIDLMPVNKLWEKNIKEFTKTVKTRPQCDGDSNMFDMKVRYMYRYKEIISCVFAKKMFFCGEKDTLESYVSVNYLRNGSRVLTFTDVFDVDNGNLKDFNSLFSMNMTLEQLKNVSFNIEKDTVSINAGKRYRQPLKKVKSYIKDVE